MPNLAQIKLPIQQLIRKNNKKGWSNEHTEIVKQLKGHYKKLPKLRLPDKDDKLILQSDAS